MKTILCYTRKPIDEFFYDPRIAYSMHIAIEQDGEFVALNHNSGVLFAKATENRDGSLNPKCIKHPFVFDLRSEDGDRRRYGVIAIITGPEGEPDEENRGYVAVYESDDLLDYDDPVYIKLSDDHIERAVCSYDESGEVYVITWQQNDAWFESRVAYIPPRKDFSTEIELQTGAVPVEGIIYKTEETLISDGISECSETSETDKQYDVYNLPAQSAYADIEGCVPECTFEISDDVADRLISKIGFRKHVSTIFPETLSIPSIGELFNMSAIAVYNDGTTAIKRIDWDKDQIAEITEKMKQLDEAGSSKEDGSENISVGRQKIEFDLTGKLHQDVYDFPLCEHRADPCIGYWNGKYYFIATTDSDIPEDNNHTLYVREAYNIPELFTAEEKLILDSDTYDYVGNLLWAPEFHEIDGKLYIFLALTPDPFFHEESHVMELREGGNPSVKEDWSAPKRVVRADGSDICEAGKTITLDMTCFMWEDEYYVVWSQRQFVPKDLGAWLYIARLNRKEPWKLDSEPVLLSKPDYGWANNHTFVDEGPFAIVTEDRLFLTFSSAAVDTSYVVGLLTLNKGDDPLCRKNWKKTGYPLLTSRSVEGQFGTGHNAYVMDAYGDLWNTYHARPGIRGPRSSGIRRVHFDIDGVPVLDLAQEDDVTDEISTVHTRVIIG